MLMVVESANTDLPLYSFCIDLLLGSKYGADDVKICLQLKIFKI
jgi:hypothetical protein